MEPIAPHVARIRSVFVNLYLVGEPGGPWALVDTGLPGGFDHVRAAAEERFGTNAKPEAVYLTHGHFDHAGSALALATFWGVPVYAHRLEMPFLTGKSQYPPTDPTPGGAISFMSRFFPSSKIDLGDHVRELPPSRTLPGLDRWEWVETPGHSPGHVSFFRPDDKVLLAGDAFTTVDMDGALALATQKQQVARAPTPFTCDWVQARRSVVNLAGLKPYTVACGHGAPMIGPDVADLLETHAQEFMAPRKGRYVAEPARTDENGIVALPPAPPDPLPKVLVGAGVAAALGALVLTASRQKKKGSGT